MTDMDCRLINVIQNPENHTLSPDLDRRLRPGHTPF